MYVGWTADSKGFVSLWNADGCEFGEADDEQPAADIDGFIHLVERMFEG